MQPIAHSPDAGDRASFPAPEQHPILSFGVDVVEDHVVHPQPAGSPVAHGCTAI